jgi:hypothetical protein
MTSSTKQMGHLGTEFRRSFIVTMVLLTFATLLLFAFSDEYAREGDNDYVNSRFLWAPYLIAAGHTVSQGISEFSRAASGPVPDGAHTTVLFGLIGFYVVLPTALLFTWRSRLLKRLAGGPREPEGASYAILIASGIMATLMLIATVGGAVSQRMIYDSLVSAQTQHANKDMLINTVNEVMLQLRTHRAMPASLGGGDGSYDGFTLPEDLAKTDDGTITLDIVPDDVTITAHSSRYDGASVGVIFTPDGVTSWSYEGAFR